MSLVPQTRVFQQSEQSNDRSQPQSQVSVSLTLQGKQSSRLNLQPQVSAIPTLRFHSSGDNSKSHNLIGGNSKQLGNFCISQDKGNSLKIRFKCKQIGKQISSFQSLLRSFVYRCSSSSSISAVQFSIDLFGPLIIYI